MTSPIYNICTRCGRKATARQAARRTPELSRCEAVGLKDLLGCSPKWRIDCSDPKGLAEYAWQAAQADAFERAAKVCLDQTRNLKDTKYVRRNAKRNLYLWRCAEAIRALAKEVEK